jgi:hypothetical protein
MKCLFGSFSDFHGQIGHKPILEETQMNETPIPPAPHRNDQAIIITSIIAVAFVLVACIAGCSAPFIIAALSLY